MRASTTAAVCAALGAALALLASQTLLKGHEASAADRIVSEHARPVPLRSDLVIVAVDDQSTAHLPFQSPTSRALLADVVDALDKRGASVIGLDFIFDRPTRADEDARLVAAIMAARGEVIVAANPGDRSRDAICNHGASSGGADRDILPEIAAIATVADAVLCLDGDGVVRRMGRSTGGSPLFAEALVRATGKTGSAAGRLTPHHLTPGAGRGGGRGLPFPIYSAQHLESLPADWFAGRTVLVGAMTPYSGDWFATPLRYSAAAPPIEPRDQLPTGMLPGVVVHAFQTAALLDGRRGADDRGWLAAMLALAGAAFGAASVLRPAGWRTRVAGALGFAGAAYLVGLMAAIPARALWDVAIPLTPLPLGIIAATAIGVATQESNQRQQKQQVRRAFEHYLAPAVVEALVQHPEQLNLQAAPREISVLFTDLAGFSTFVDTHAAKVVTSTLNAYLETVMGEVIRAGGVVDKIVGDAVHALFSVPLEDKTHRLRALECALAIDRASETLRRRFKAAGVDIGETRIGVHAGVAIVGNFGGANRFDFTAHGSTINATARLEAANKVFGTRICMSEHALVEAPGVMFRPVARVRLRGIGEPMRVFEPVRIGGSRGPWAAEYAAAMSLAETDPAGGLARLEALLAVSPSDPLVEFQLRRLRSGEHVGDVLDV